MTSLFDYDKKNDTGTFPLLDDYSVLLEDKFIHLIESKSGIVLDHIKRRDIKQNIAACMEESQETSFNRYHENLIAHGGDNTDLKKLINFMTINETFFFRVHEHFEILEKVVIPQLREKKRDKTLSVWSAGASSGEEVYSIIITLLEIPGLKEKFDLQVLGTDINEDMLYLAEKAVYSGRTLGKVSPYLLAQYFEPFLTDRYRVKEEVKKYARFHYLNFAQPFNLDFFGRPDIIFFRNVLIYFDKETTRKIIDTFYHLLKDDGYLILGPSETLWELSDQFQLMMFENAYIYRKISSKKITAESASTQGLAAAAASLHRTVPIHTDIPGAISGALPPNHTFTTPEPPKFPSISDRMRIKLDEAALAIALGDYHKAGELLEELLAVEPRNKQAILLKMTLLINQVQKEHLLEYVEQVTRIYPIFPEVHFLLGRLYESLHASKEAIKEYHKVLFIDPDYLLARERLLRILDSRGDIPQAQREARNIIDALTSGKYKEMEFFVGETIHKEQLQKFCCRVLG